MDSILSDIKIIDHNNKFIKYIIERIQRDKYRGTHVSQHNRYDLSDITNMIQSIYKTVDNNIFEIPRGDYNRNFNDNDLIGTFKEYKDIVDNIKKTTGKGTYNSVKKNFFVDMDRAGILKRYDKNKNIISSKKGVYYAELSSDAIRFLDASIIERYRIFTDFLDGLFNNFLSEFVDILYSSQYREDTISIYEFMFIFSDESIDGGTKITLLDEYRKLDNIKKERLVQLIKKYANPDNFRGSKKNKRDFHNWKNEAQQIFSLLNNTSYFQVDKKGEYIKLNIGNYGIFNIETFKRSNKPKKDYFIYHNVEKTTDFELHHIVPISKARNKEEVKIIDNVYNLIYVHKKKHTEFTRNKNLNMIIGDLNREMGIFKECNGEIINI